MKTLHSTVKALRSLGFTQDQIAAKAKVSQMTISRWEKAEPKLVNVAALTRLSNFLEKVRDEQ